MRCLYLRCVIPILLLLTLATLVAGVCHAQAPAPPQPPTPPKVWLNEAPPQEMALTLRIVIGLAAMTLIPAALMMMTSFTRIIIVLGFLRNALGTPSAPPNTVIVGLAIFLTGFVMQPVFNQINEAALEPWMQGRTTLPVAMERAWPPLRDFMIKQTRDKDLLLFLRLAHLQRPTSPEKLPASVLLSGFVISELRTAFQLGFVLYIPFLVLDLVVASILMSLGMMMLPPVTISLPLKLILFVMIDGWHLVAQSVVIGFH